jgi:hypothetical protein
MAHYSFIKCTPVLPGSLRGYVRRQETRAPQNNLTIVPGCLLLYKLQHLLLPAALQMQPICTRRQVLYRYDDNLVRCRQRQPLYQLPGTADDLHIHFVIYFIQLQLQYIRCWVGEHQYFCCLIIFQKLDIAVFDLPIRAFYFQPVILIAGCCFIINESIGFPAG